MCCHPQVGVDCGVDPVTRRFVFCTDCFLRTLYYVTRTRQAVTAAHPTQQDAATPTLVQATRDALTKALGLDQAWSSDTDLADEVDDFIAEVCLVARRNGLWDTDDDPSLAGQPGDEDEYAFVAWVVARVDDYAALNPTRRPPAPPPPTSAHAPAQPGISAALLSPARRADGGGGGGNNTAVRPSRSPNPWDLTNIPDAFFDPETLWPQTTTHNASRPAPVPAPAPLTQEWEAMVLAELAKEAQPGPSKATALPQGPGRSTVSTPERRQDPREDGGRRGLSAWDAWEAWDAAVLEQLGLEPRES